jgi:cytosine/creatinine deaminase
MSIRVGNGGSFVLYRSRIIQGAAIRYLRARGGRSLAVFRYREFRFLRFRRVGSAMDQFLKLAIEEARQGLAEGGIPIGSVLAIGNQVVGRGHNRRVQKGSAILHAEMDCLENAGRLTPAEYRRAVLYSTLSPCDMCSGTALLYRIPRIVIGENRTFQGPEDYVRSRGVSLEIVNDAECIQLMEDFIAARPELWNEDIGEV